MRHCPAVYLAIVCTCVGAARTPASAQVVELTGSRAAGMGGAFVAVASDSSGTWWNPAGLAAGPFVDVSVARGLVESPGEGPLWRDRTSSFALGTPVIGLSYYRLRLTDIQPSDPIAGAVPDRENGGAGVPVRSLAANQFGVTLVQTVTTGVHVGATLKYVRGTLMAGHEDALAPRAALLDRGEAFEGGGVEGRFDLDVGVLATAGGVRLGARMRNLREPAFGSIQLERQTRVGVAFDAGAAGGVPLTIAVDADVDAYRTASGPRRVVALGAEQWVWNRRVGLRGGGRLNTAGPAGARGRSATAGASIALRTGMYVEGHVVRGGAADERGWGFATRMSF